MKVNAATSTKISKNTPKKPTVKASKEDVMAKIRAKFGDKALQKKKPKKTEDSSDIKTKAKPIKEEESFGDIGKNNPDSELTQSKLKGVLKSGAFKFSDRERATLAKILK